MGSGDVLKLGYVARDSKKIHDAKIEPYTTNGQGARAIGEDIIAYCQIKLAEGTKNDCIDIVKRNMTNLFEDIEDPFAEGNLFDEEHALLKQTGGNIPGVMSAAMRSKLSQEAGGTNHLLNSNKRQSFLIGGNGDFHQQEG